MQSHGAGTLRVVSSEESDCSGVSDRGWSVDRGFPAPHHTVVYEDSRWSRG